MTDATTGLPPGPAHDYLARLVHLTGDLPPHARVDLLSSIEEHLRDALDRGELADALRRLGSAEEVAAAVRHEAGGHPVARPPGTTTTSGPGTARVAAGATLVLVVALSALGAWFAVVTGADPPGPLRPHALEVVLLVLVGLVAGAVVSVLALVARTLSRSDRWVLVAAWGAALVAVPVAVVLSAAAPPPARWVVAVGVLAVGGWALAGVAGVAGPRRRRRGMVGG